MVVESNNITKWRCSSRDKTGDRGQLLNRRGGAPGSIPPMSGIPCLCDWSLSLANHEYLALFSGRGEPFPFPMLVSPCCL